MGVSKKVLLFIGSMHISPFAADDLEACIGRHSRDRRVRPNSHHGCRGAASHNMSRTYLPKVLRDQLNAEVMILTSAVWHAGPGHARSMHSGNADGVDQG